MAKVIWTAYALEDLKAVYDYIAQDSLIYALKFTEKVLDKVAVLEMNPLLGRTVPEFNDTTLRELIEGSYRIIYKVESKDEVGIIRLHHSAKLLKGL